MMFPIFVLAFLLTPLAACTPEKPPVSLELPPTPVLTSDSIWGVANKPYLKMLKSASVDAEVSGVLREGDVVRVFSKVGEPDGSGYWLDIRLPDSAVRGWVKDTDLDVYDTEPQAKTARESLLGNEVLSQ